MQSFSHAAMQLLRSFTYACLMIVFHCDGSSTDSGNQRFVRMPSVLRTWAAPAAVASEVEEEHDLRSEAVMEGELGAVERLVRDSYRLWRKAEAAAHAAESDKESFDSALGDTSPLTEDGYQAVAALESNSEMTSFIRRVIEDLHRTVVDEGGLAGFVPFFSGVEDVQSFKSLLEEVRVAPWTQSNLPIRKLPHPPPGYSGQSKKMDVLDGGPSGFARNELPGQVFGSQGAWHLPSKGQALAWPAEVMMKGENNQAHTISVARRKTPQAWMGPDRQKQAQTQAPPRHRPKISDVKKPQNAKSVSRKVQVQSPLLPMSKHGPPLLATPVRGLLDADMSTVMSTERELSPPLNGLLGKLQGNKASHIILAMALKSHPAENNMTSTSVGPAHMHNRTAALARLAIPRPRVTEKSDGILASFSSRANKSMAGAIAYNCSKGAGRLEVAKNSEGGDSDSAHGLALKTTASIHPTSSALLVDKSGHSISKVSHDGNSTIVQETRRVHPRSFPTALKQNSKAILVHSHADGWAERVLSGLKNNSPGPHPPNQDARQVVAENASEQIQSSASEGQVQKGAQHGIQKGNVSVQDIAALVDGGVERNDTLEARLVKMASAPDAKAVAADERHARSFVNVTHQSHLFAHSGPKLADVSPASKLLGERNGLHTNLKIVGTDPETADTGHLHGRRMPPAGEHIEGTTKGSPRTVVGRVASGAVPNAAHEQNSVRSKGETNAEQENDGRRIVNAQRMGYTGSHSFLGEESKSHHSDTNVPKPDHGGSEVVVSDHPAHTAVGHAVGTKNLIANEALGSAMSFLPSAALAAQPKLDGNVLASARHPGESSLQASIWPVADRMDANTVTIWGQPKANRASGIESTKGKPRLEFGPRMKNDGNVVDSAYRSWESRSQWNTKGNAVVAAAQFEDVEVRPSVWPNAEKMDVAAGLKQVKASQLAGPMIQKPAHLLRPQSLTQRLFQEAKTMSSKLSHITQSVQEQLRSNEAVFEAQFWEFQNKTNIKRNWVRAAGEQLHIALSRIRERNHSCDALHKHVTYLIAASDSTAFLLEPKTYTAKDTVGMLKVSLDVSVLREIAALTTVPKESSPTALQRNITAMRNMQHELLNLQAAALTGLRERFGIVMEKAAKDRKEAELERWQVYQALKVVEDVEKACLTAQQVERNTDTPQVSTRKREAAVSISTPAADARAFLSGLHVAKNTTVQAAMARAFLNKIFANMSETDTDGDFWRPSQPIKASKRLLISKV